MLTSKMKESLSCLNATLMRPLPLCVFSLEQKGAKFELPGDFRYTWVVYMGVWVVKSKMTPHGMAELTTKIWRENEIQTGELNIRSDN